MCHRAHSLTALAAPAGAAACANTGLVPTATNLPAVRSAVGCLLNQQRASRGLRPRPSPRP